MSSTGLHKLAHVIFEMTQKPFYITSSNLVRIGMFPVQNLLGTWLGLGTQPHYKAPGDLWVEQVHTQ